MIGEVRAVKNKVVWLCKWVRPHTFKCGKCNRGIIVVYPGENRHGYVLVTKRCAVCDSKIKVTEITR